MLRYSLALVTLFSIVSAEIAHGHYDPQKGRFLQRDIRETGIPPVMANMPYHGRAPIINFSAYNPRVHYANGMNVYQYVGSNPVMRRDPSGMFFSLPELAVTAGEYSYLQSQDAYRTGLAAAFVFSALGAAITNGTWGVGGGMTASGFDTFLEGVEATMSGSYALGESLMVAGELSALAVYSMSQADAVEKCKNLWTPISLHFTKFATGGGDWGSGPDSWKKQIEAWLRQVEGYMKHMGRKTGDKWADWLRATREAIEEAIRNGGGTPPPMPG